MSKSLEPPATRYYAPNTHYMDNIRALLKGPWGVLEGFKYLDIFSCARALKVVSYRFYRMRDRIL